MLEQVAQRHPDDHIRSLEPETVRYLGPEFSFSHIVGLVLFSSDDENARTRRPALRMHHNFPATAQALLHDPSAVGIFPVENSLTTTVQPVVDLLLTGKFFVLAEARLLVNLFLAGNGESPDDVRKVFSHSKALGQAARLLYEKNLEPVEEESTSAAAEKVASMDGQAAALCSLRAAKHFKLNILKRNVQDDPNNQTRFLIVQSNSGNHRPELEKLTKRFIKPSDPAKVAGVVLPELPTSANGFHNAMGHMIMRGLVPEDLGKRFASSDSTGGDKEYFVEFSGDANTLLQVFSRDSSYEDFMTFDRLGVYPQGSLYQE